jgi:hypothetical protein
VVLRCAIDKCGIGDGDGDEVELRLISLRWLSAVLVSPYLHKREWNVSNSGSGDDCAHLDEQSIVAAHHPGRKKGITSTKKFLAATCFRKCPWHKGTRRREAAAHPTNTTHPPSMPHVIPKAQHLESVVVAIASSMVQRATHRCSCS